MWGFFSKKNKEIYMQNIFNCQIIKIYNMHCKNRELRQNFEILRVLYHCVKRSEKIGIDRDLN